MLKQSKFELSYKFERGEIIRKIHSSSKADTFSNSYETLRVFNQIPGKKECSSSVIKTDQNEYIFFTKGEPLEIKELCQKSTLAYNYTQTVSKYASKGY